MLESYPDAARRLRDNLAQACDQFALMELYESAQQHRAIRHRFARGEHVGNGSE